MRCFGFPSGLRVLTTAVLLGMAVAPSAVAHAQSDCSPLITTDFPQPGATVQGTTTFSGWAVDESAAQGSGVTSVQIAADGYPGAGGTMLGTATAGDRPDVDSALGVSSSYGFTLNADLSGLPAGMHWFYIDAATSCGIAVNMVAANVQSANVDTVTVSSSPAAANTADSQATINMTVAIPANGSSPATGNDQATSTWSTTSSTVVQMPPVYTQPSTTTVMPMYTGPTSAPGSSPTPSPSNAAPTTGNPPAAYADHRLLRRRHSAAPRLLLTPRFVPARTRGPAAFIRALLALCY